MNEKIKTFLTSEKTMRVIPGAGIIYLAYLLWIAYLVYFIRRTPSRVIKIWNSILIILASGMILVNLYFMLRTF